MTPTHVRPAVTAISAGLFTVGAASVLPPSIALACGTVLAVAVVHAVTPVGVTPARRGTR